MGFGRCRYPQIGTQTNRFEPMLILIYSNGNYVLYKQDTLTMRFSSWASGEVMLTACTSMFPMIAFFTSPPGYIGLYPMLSLSPLRSFTSLPLWLDHVLFLGMRKSVSDQISLFAHLNESNKRNYYYSVSFDYRRG